MYSAASFAAQLAPQKQHRRYHRQKKHTRRLCRFLFRSSTSKSRFCGGGGEEAHITYRFNDDGKNDDDDDEEAEEDERTRKNTKKKSICIVGGCGRIGSLITRTILNDPERRYERVHVLTRNVNNITQNDLMRKMKEENEEEGRLRLTFGECDVTNFTAEQLLESVKGYDEVVACFGAQRISKPFDWITNAENVDERHPKSVNFWGVRKLAFAAKEGGCERFVRVTGMSVGYSAFDFIAVLLNNVLSMTIKFQLLGELAIREACVANDETKSKRMSYTIVRPGNLTDWEGIDNNSDDEKNSGGSSSSSTKSSRSSGGANNKNNNNNERVVVLTHGANHIDASKVSREDVAHIIFVALQNRKATENVTISIAGANKATAGMRSAFRWDPARGAYWETQAIDDANVQILSKWSDLDVRKFQPDEKNDLKEKAHQFWAWSFLLSAFGVAYLFLRAIFSLVRFFMLSLTSSTFAVV